MSESRKKYDQEFKTSAVRIVEESGRPIAQIARDLWGSPLIVETWSGRLGLVDDGTHHADC